MKTDKKWQKTKGILLKLVKIVSISVGSILVFLLLLYFFLNWLSQTPTNPPNQYNTPVVYHGRIDTNVRGPLGYDYNPKITALAYLFDSMARCRIKYTGKTFEIEVTNIIYKEEALRILQHGVDEGEIYVDDQNYLVTE